MLIWGCLCFTKSPHLLHPFFRALEAYNQEIEDLKREMAVSSETAHAIRRVVERGWCSVPLGPEAKHCPGAGFCSFASRRMDSSGCSSLHPLHP